MPEPFIGDIHNARFATVAINPVTRCRDSSTATACGPRLIRNEHGVSYTEWAATSPYTSEWWTTTMGRNRNVVSRVDFASGWTGRGIKPSEVLFLETWWWHSKGWDGGRYARVPGLERDVLWDPIQSLGLDRVFGLGRGFVDSMNDNPETEIVDRLGKGGVSSKPTTLHWTIGAHSPRPSPSRRSRSNRSATPHIGSSSRPTPPGAIAPQP